MWTAWKPVYTSKSMRFFLLVLSWLFSFSRRLLNAVIYKYSRCLLWSGLQPLSLSCCLIAVTSLFSLVSICSRLRSGELLFTSRLGARICARAHMFESFCVCVCVNHACVGAAGFDAPASECSVGASSTTGSAWRWEDSSLFWTCYPHHHTPPTLCNPPTSQAPLRAL